METTGICIESRVDEDPLEDHVGFRDKGLELFRV